MKKSISHWLLTGLCLLGSWAALTVEAWAQPTSGAMFLPLTTPTARAATPLDPQVVRSREMALNLPKVAGLNAVAKKQAIDAQTIELNLFDDVNFTAIASDIAPTQRGFSWVGRLLGVPDSTVVLAMSNGVVSGNVTTPDGRYHIRHVQPGVYRIEQIDTAKFPDDHPHGSESLTPPAEKKTDITKSAATAQADDGSMIDVMVVYTPAARAAAGGTAGITSLIDLAVAETNTIYQNSGITQRVRVVRAEEVSYSEATRQTPDTFTSALNCITQKTDGCLDDIHTTRNTFGADLVSFWIEDATSCGLGWLSSTESLGFSVVARSCATGNYSFAHEMGHNSGAKHDRYVDTSTTPIAYAHGFVSVAGRWRTVMSYNNECQASGVNCTRVQYFSNPSVTYNGTATGNASTADNSRVLNASAFNVANFRSSVTPSSTTSTSTTTTTAPVTPSIDIAGIYQNTVNPGYYLTVYQNNGTLITTAYSAFAVSNFTTRLSAGTVRPDFIDYFTVLNGTINGLQGSVSGYDSFRACRVTASVVFTATTATSTITSTTASTQGSSQGTNCQVNDPVGSVITWKKIL